MPDYRQDHEQALAQVLSAMRENPERYQSVRRELSTAGSDEERVRALLNFATSERELAALIPVGTVGENQELFFTTVTVTTVFILEGSAY